jgi:hypothetical protein
MSYVPGYESDVFVSYAQVDDRPLPPATVGWVCTLVDTLKILLAQQLGRAELFTVWRDLGLAGNAPLTAEIFNALRASATMLVILSEGYLASEWCQREQNEFLDTVGKGSRRLFVVERMPIARERKPGEFQDLIGYPFWVRERDEVPPRTLGVPMPSAAEPEYYNRLNRLASELSRELRRARAATST